ncbi:RagB/SusD family nutrient uptake outer membrane protein [Algoriphagus sp. H41]|uniref:RagB/SusD family nutrient uptake outer membrane protein n=1 Tax=Algoriphagus oliviformis TaxID=2811231 RepID=A0ABS3C3I4_9BACT|nr:RagB/SusD family nutrient uptake outer membrane protein [Algoriphagus oliviformis]MBN7811425.1 RagB/SusD family nutrient uptake outer membrane protein [Algoriphagus oliviformis]
MKNILKTLILGGALLLGSCDSMLETEPRQSLTPETAFTDVKSFESLLFSIYGRVRSFNYYGQTMLIAPEIMADNLRIIANTGRYIGQEANADRQHINLWSYSTTGLFTAINEANILLTEIDKVEGDEALRTKLKGEASFLRALFYFDLARVYGYEPGQEVSGWNAAVILRTTPTLGLSNADFRSRSTNREVYDQIEADLNVAISSLAVQSMGTAGIYRASKGAAELLLSRVYLYEGKNAEAVTMATQAMGTLGLSNTGTGLVSAAGYEAAFNTFPNPESVFEMEIRSVDWSTVDGVNNSMCSLTANVYTGAQFIVTATDELLAAYDAGDVRKTMWAETTRSGADGVVYRSKKWLGAKGDFLENLPILRASELYLIRAEARQKTGNDSGALADLNALRSKRGVAPLAGLSGNSLFQAILKERRTEFALEGHRWFDLKRNGLTISKAGSFEPVPYADYRILAPLPQDEITLNELLENNPGYN